MCAVGSCGCSVITKDVREQMFSMFIADHDRSSPLFHYGPNISYKRMPEKGFKYLGSEELAVLSGITGLQGEELFKEISHRVRMNGREFDEFYALQYAPEEDFNHVVVDENVFAIYFWVDVDLLEFARRAA